MFPYQLTLKDIINVLLFRESSMIDRKYLILSTITKSSWRNQIFTISTAISILSPLPI